MNLLSKQQPECESRGSSILLAHLGCSKPQGLLHQHQGDAQVWGCSGCLHSHCATWKWFLLSSGNRRIISTPLLTLVEIPPPPRNSPQLPRQFVEGHSSVTGKIRPLGSQEHSLSASGSKLLPKEHSKQVGFILGRGKKQLTGRNRMAKVCHWLSDA